MFLGLGCHGIVFCRLASLLLLKFHRVVFETVCGSDFPGLVFSIMIGKGSLPQESSCTPQLYSIKVAGSLSVRSIAENVPEDELRWV